MIALNDPDTIAARLKKVEAAIVRHTTQLRPLRAERSRLRRLLRMHEEQFKQPHREHREAAP